MIPKPDPSDAWPPGPDGEPLDPSACPQCGRDACEDHVPGDAQPEQHKRLFNPVSVGELYDTTSEEVEWLLHELIPMGALVLLAAFMKAGKSTLAYALIAAILKGEPFLDRPTRRTNVLLLALEESKRDVKRRLLKFGVPRDAGLFVQFRPVPTTPDEWVSLVEFVQAHEIGLVVLDTLSRCWPVWNVDNENDNAKVAAALAPALDLCREQNVTLLPLHHTGKITEGNGREVRGAGAILALADQALLFDRYRSGDPCDRIIKTLGRYDESPGETVIRYDKFEGTYTSVSEEERQAAPGALEKFYPSILTYLRKRTLTGASLREARQNVHGRNSSKDAALGSLVQMGRVHLIDGRYYHADHTPEAGE